MEEKINNPKETGIINFWDLPKIHILLKEEFKNNLFREFLEIAKSSNNAGRLVKLSGATIRSYLKKDHKIGIGSIIKIAKIINKKEFSIEDIQKNIIWIGSCQSHGIINPFLPFNFNKREGARFLAAICNDGWISDEVYYSNSEEDLRNSVINDTLSVFGGDENTIHIWIKDKDQYLSFPSVIRDALNLITEFKGVKSENNPPVPSFILKNIDLICGWIEQTIADEGCVKYYPKEYRREMIWTRSFKTDLIDYKLHVAEIIMLNELGIKYEVYDVGKTKTKDNIEKIRKGIRIAERNNLIKLRKLINIPCKRKDKNFTAMINGYVRYKEVLKIKETIIKICNEKGYVDTHLLMKEMNYKQINASYKWLKLYEKEGLLKCCSNYSYTNKFRGRVPAKYILN